MAMLLLVCIFSTYFSISDKYWHNLSSASTKEYFSKWALTAAPKLSNENKRLLSSLCNLAGSNESREFLLASSTTRPSFHSRAENFWKKDNRSFAKIKSSCSPV